jgi:hypothetical protein
MEVVAIKWAMKPSLIAAKQTTNNTEAKLAFYPKL